MSLCPHNRVGREAGTLGEERGLRQLKALRALPSSAVTPCKLESCQRHPSKVLARANIGAARNRCGTACERDGLISARAVRSVDRPRLPQPADQVRSPSGECKGAQPAGGLGCGQAQAPPSAQLLGRHATGGVSRELDLTLPAGAGRQTGASVALSRLRDFGALDSAPFALEVAA